MNPTLGIDSDSHLQWGMGIDSDSHLQWGWQSAPGGLKRIVRATVPFHGEHDAPEPTKVKRGQGGGRASALAPEL